MKFKMQAGIWRLLRVLALWLLPIIIAFAAGLYWPKGPLVGVSGSPTYVGASASDIVLPKIEGPFGGEIRRTADASRQALPDLIAPPKGAPNILLVLTDDVGFGASSTFGGPIPTPNLTRIAQRGLRYTRFHTTAMCSPTRAALLTGRNQHRVGAGTVADIASGFPGYNSVMPKSAATLGRVLTGNGYNTAFFGKHHNVPNWEATAAGPFERWPTGLGFEYFYGFLGGDTDQFHPVLYRNTTRVSEEARPADRVLDEDLADDAIRWVRNQKAAAPSKPFFIYYAPGSAHAPQQAPQAWREKFRGKFAMGWDLARTQTFERQKAMGIIPADATLPERLKSIPAWDTLSTDEKAVDERFMEVFAAELSYQDFQFGRILDELARMKQLDNTLIIFIEGDNGASPEGDLSGTIDEIGHLANGVQETTADHKAALDELGGPHTYEVYPVGWAAAMDAPFLWTKQVASHLGGTRNGLVISWPDKIKDFGGIRTQFHHVNDIVPTILALTGIPAPTVVDGVRQISLDGVSMTPSIDDAKAGERHTTQYFEMLGYRAIYQDGWLLSTTPKNPPWEGDAPSTDAVHPKWELYNLATDFTQAHDLAGQEPQRVADLEQLWWHEASRNGVLPVDVNRGLRRLNALMFRINVGREEHARTDYTFFGPDVHIAQAAQPTFFSRNFTISADVTIPPQGGAGAIVAAGSWFGGWTFYLDHGRPAAHHAFSPLPRDQFHIAAASPLAPGPVHLEFDFHYDGMGLGKGGTLKILANGRVLAQGRVDRQITIMAGIGETFDIGDDTGVPVIAYPGDIHRFNGLIGKVAIQTGGLKMLPF